MEFLEKYRKHIIISSILLVFLALSIFIYYKSYNSKKDHKTKIADAVILEKEEEMENVEEITEEIVVPEEYYVDIKGAVTNPGVYKLSSDSRVNDVVNLAGGVNSDADTRCINLSKKIKDEMVIYVYTKQEVEEMYKIEEKKEDNIIFNNVINDAYVDYTNPDSGSIDTNNESNNSEVVSTGKININTADISLLTTLPNIGESKAQAIITKRDELGKFNSIDELKEVSGIGESTFEKVKDLITVEWLIC